MPESCCQPWLVSEESEKIPRRHGYPDPGLGSDHWARPPALPVSALLLLWPGRKGRESPFTEAWALVAGSCIPCLLSAEPVASGPMPPRAEQSRARHLEVLQRQLQVELKVKQGAENMIHTCASGTPKVSVGA